MSASDENWRPSATLDMLRTRAAVLQGARTFLAGRGLLEVDTPALAEAGVTDPHIDGLTVRLNRGSGTELHLQTSPEFAMKRLLAAGCPDLDRWPLAWRPMDRHARLRPDGAVGIVVRETRGLTPPPGCGSPFGATRTG